MTNKIEISRELLEDLLSPFADYATYDTLRALLAKSDGTLTDEGTMPAVERQDVLPCDVRVAPATTIRKGCKVETLMQCIELRKGQPDKFTRFKSSAPPAPVSVVLPRYTCIGKGGEYELLGRAIGAGTLKDMSAIPVYRDTTTGQLFVRTPLDFATRMECLDKVKELNQ